MSEFKWGRVDGHYHDGTEFRDYFVGIGDVEDEDSYPPNDEEVFYYFMPEETIIRAHDSFVITGFREER